MSETGSGFARNSLASLLRTLSGGFLAVLLPPLLLRRLGPEPYGVWAIAVEIGTYLGVLDLGALSAVGHFATKATGEDGRHGHGHVVATMIALQLAIAAAGTALLAVIIALVPDIYSRMPASLVPSARWTLALIGGSSLLGLLATTLTGYFLAIHRIALPSAITFGSRLVGAAAVAVLALRGDGIAALAVAWAACTVAGYLLITLVYLQLKVRTRPSMVRRDLARQMVSFSTDYGLWIAAAFLIVGLDTTIVARLDFKAVAPYAAAAGVASIVGAVYGSALAPLVPVAAKLTDEGRSRELSQAFLRLMRVGGIVVVVLSALATLAAAPLFRLWIGGVTARQGIPLLQVLIAANGLRILLQPFPVLVFGTGEHRRIRYLPFAEAGVNLVASIALGLAFGPIGVAEGSLIGAFVGVGMQLFVGVPRIASMGISGWDVVWGGLRLPLAAALPALGAFAVRPALPSRAWPEVAAVAAAATIGLASRGVGRAEWISLRGLIGRRPVAGEGA